MYKFFMIVLSALVVVLAGPIPEDSNDSIDINQFQDGNADLDVEPLGKLDSSSSSQDTHILAESHGTGCNSDASTEVNDNAQDGGIFRRGTTFCPVVIPPTENQYMGRKPIPKPSTTTSEETCPDKLKPEHVTCGGPEVVAHPEQDDTDIDWVVNCKKGKFPLAPFVPMRN